MRLDTFITSYGSTAEGVVVKLKDGTVVAFRDASTAVFRSGGYARHDLGDEARHTMIEGEPYSILAWFNLEGGQWKMVREASRVSAMNRPIPMAIDLDSSSASITETITHLAGIREIWGPVLALQENHRQERAVDFIKSRTRDAMRARAEADAALATLPGHVRAAVLHDLAKEKAPEVKLMKFLLPVVAEAGADDPAADSAEPKARSRRGPRA